MTTSPSDRLLSLEHAIDAARAIGGPLGWKAADIVQAAREFEAYVEGDGNDDTPGDAVVATFAELASDVRYYDPQWRMQLLRALIGKVHDGWVTIADDVIVQEADENERAAVMGVRGKAVFWADRPSRVDSTHMTSGPLFEIPRTRNATFKAHLNENDLKSDDLETILESVVTTANRQIGAGLTDCLEHLVTASGRPREMGDIVVAWFGCWAAKEYADEFGIWTFEGARSYGAVLVPK